MCVALLVMGCSSGPASAPQTFDIAGVNVQFAPPVGWKQRAADPKAKDKNHDKTKNFIVFEHPSGNGVLGVGAVPEQKTLDKTMLNQLGVDIVQSKGKIVSDKWIPLLGEKEKAYRMEFEVNEGVNRGLQLHFIQGDRLYSIVMTVPAAEFAKSQQQFDALVNSLSFPGK